MTHSDLDNIKSITIQIKTLLSPVELVKIRSQMFTDGKRGSASAFRELYQNGGRFSTCHWFFFEILSEKCPRNPKKVFLVKMVYFEDSQHSLPGTHSVTVYILCHIQLY